MELGWGRKNIWEQNIWEHGWGRKGGMEQEEHLGSGRMGWGRNRAGGTFGNRTSGDMDRARKNGIGKEEHLGSRREGAGMGQEEHLETEGT